MSETMTVRTSRSSSIPQAARDYFERFAGIDLHADHPLIAQVYGPGRGWRWRRYPIRKRVSYAAIRKLRTQEGVTSVQLASAGHFADFTVTELLRRNR